MRRRTRKPEAPPPYDPGPWKARLVQMGRYRWRIEITRGAIKFGPEWGSSDFYRWGEQRARRFAVKTITRLTLRDEREKDREARARIIEL